MTSGYISEQAQLSWNIYRATEDGGIDGDLPRIGTVREVETGQYGDVRTCYDGFLDGDPFSVGRFPTRAEAEAAVWNHWNYLQRRMVTRRILAGS